MGHNLRPTCPPYPNTKESYMVDKFLRQVRQVGTVKLVNKPETDIK